MVINTCRIRKINIIVETRVTLVTELMCVNMRGGHVFSVLRIEDCLDSKLFRNAEIAKGYYLFLVWILIACLFRMVVTIKQCLLRQNKCSALTV